MWIISREFVAEVDEDVSLSRDNLRNMWGSGLKKMHQIEKLILYFPMKFVIETIYYLVFFK